MIASRPGSFGRSCPHRFDQTAHRNVRPARRLTFRRVALSYCSDEPIIQPRASPGGTMTTPIPPPSSAAPAPAPRLERAAAALTAHGFTVEILDDAAAARTRVQELIPEGASVFTAASETL